MKILFQMDENEKCTPIKIADALINNNVLGDIDLEEIAEYILVYCHKQNIRKMQPSAVPYYK